MAIQTVGVVETRQDLQGIVTPAAVTVSDGGHGNITVHSPYGVAKDTRQSIIDAARAAARYLGLDATRYDYAVEIGADAGPMSGPSAGSQFALGFVVALHNLGGGLDWSLVPDYAGTGTISAGGAVGEVGGVPEKAEAAVDAGARTFAYPRGPVYEESGTTVRAIDMQAKCDDLAIDCVQVATLAALVQVAVPAA